MKLHWKDFLLIGVILWAVLMTFTAVNKNEYAESKEIDLKRAKDDLKKKDENIRKLISDLHEQELRAIKVMQEATIRAERAEQNLNKANEKLKKVAFRATRSDHERDSLLKAVLSQH